MKKIQILFLLSLLFCKDEGLIKAKKVNKSGKIIYLEKLEGRADVGNSSLIKNFEENLAFDFISNGFQIKKWNNDLLTINKNHDLEIDALYPFYFSEEKVNNSKIGNINKDRYYDYLLKGSITSFFQEDTAYIKDYNIHFEIFNNKGNKLGVINYIGSVKNNDIDQHIAITEKLVEKFKTLEKEFEK